MPRHPDLAAIARLEHQARQRDPAWPASDTAAWAAIAELLERGTVETELEWPALITAARLAEQRRYDAAVEAGGTQLLPALETRLGQVVAIRRTLERSAWRHGFCLPSQEIAA